MDPHRLAEITSIQMHAEVAARIEDDAQILSRARERVDVWIETGEVARHYADAWARALDGPVDELLRMLVEDSERARALRQVSPFAGALDPRTRWRIWRRARTTARDSL